MHFLGLAVDFDGTIAKDGAVEASTLEALIRLKRGGRRLILVTGREFDDLARHFPRFDIFDRLVLENGAVMLDPATGQLRLLAPPPDAVLVEDLQSMGIERLSVGRSIIAAWEPDEARILAAIKRTGLELQMLFNKGAIMVLPTGINKGSGLVAAAADLNLSPASIVGVGDAENDHSFLSACGCSAAVANAIAPLKSQVDLVLDKDHGAGVRMLIGMMERLDKDLLPTNRRALPIGTDPEGKEVLLPSIGGNILVVGPSRSGKSTFATMLAERMLARRLGFGFLDPEGDYPNLEGTALLDCSNPWVDAADFEVLLQARLNPVAMLRGLDHRRRADFIKQALAVSASCRSRTGHPAFIVIDEAHQALASAGDLKLTGGPREIIITLAPDMICREILRTVDTLIVFGPDPGEHVEAFSRLAGLRPPALIPESNKPEILVWRQPDAPVRVRAAMPLQVHVRHAGKYATGDVGRERSFYFRGTGDRVCVPARNLFEFLSVGEQVSDEVWTHHLYNGDMTRWLRAVIRDEMLAKTADELRHAGLVPAASTRAVLRQAINARYCLPADAGLAS